METIIALAVFPFLGAESAANQDLGSVKSVCPGWGFVIIDVGAHQGARIGDHLTISTLDGTSYPATITEVESNQATADVPVWSPGTAKLHPGDRITSRPIRPGLKELWQKALRNVRRQRLLAVFKSSTVIEAADSYELPITRPTKEQPTANKSSARRKLIASGGC